MDEQEKARLAQALKARLDADQRPVPAVVSDRNSASLDLTPFAVVACAMNGRVRPHIDEALGHADPAWDERAGSLPLTHHPALMTLPLDQAEYACKLAGVVVAARQAEAARACLDDVLHDGWRRVWQALRAGGSVSLERFRQTHPPEPAEDADAELVVLAWYADLCGKPLEDTPLRKDLEQAILRAAYRANREAATQNLTRRNQYEAALRYHDLWYRAAQAGEDGVPLRQRAELVQEFMKGDARLSPGAVAIWHASFSLAERQADLEEMSAVTLLAVLLAVAVGDRHPETAAVTGGVRPSAAVATESPGSDSLPAQVAAAQREVRRLQGELRRAQARLGARDVEISRLLGMLAAKEDVEPEIQYTVHPIADKVLVAGGHETLSRNLQAWLPNGIFIPTNGKESLDPAVLSTVRLVIVLTSYISHAFSGKVVAEAHKRDVPILPLQWRSSKHILQEVERALAVQSEQQHHT